MEGKKVRAKVRYKLSFNQTELDDLAAILQAYFNTCPEAKEATVSKYLDLIENIED